MDKRLVECAYCHDVTPAEKGWCRKCGAKLNLIPALIRSVPVSTDPTKCPFCKGNIEPGVLKRKNCGEWLDEAHRKQEDEVKKAQIHGSSTARGFAAAIGLLIALGFIIQAWGG